MPTYVYQCSACDKTFEVEQRITADPLTDCDCGCQGTLKRVIQPIAVMFKGSGFHVNDYAPSTKPAEESKPDKTKETETPNAEPAKPAEPAASADPANTADSKTGSQPTPAS